jgi:hypothetical protein
VGDARGRQGRLAPQGEHRRLGPCRSARSIAVAAIGTNTVTWNGSILPGGSVTITITATVLPAPAGTTVTNQGTIAFDSDGNGTNDSSGVTDDPSAQGPSDPTSFVIAPGAVADIPVSSPLGLAVLILTLATAGVVTMKRG